MFLFVRADKRFGYIFQKPIFGSLFRKLTMGTMGLIVEFFARKSVLQLLFAASTAFVIIGSRGAHRSIGYNGLIDGTAQSVLTAALILVLSISISIVQSESKLLRQESFATFENISELSDKLFELIDELPAAALNGVDVDFIPLALAETKPHEIRYSDGHEVLEAITTIVQNINEHALKGPKISRFLLCAVQIEHYFSVRSTNHIRNVVAPNLWISFSVGLVALIILQIVGLMYALSGSQFGVFAGDLITIFVTTQVILSLVDILSYIAQETRELDRIDEQ